MFIFYLQETRFVCASCYSFWGPFLNIQSLYTFQRIWSWDAKISKFLAILVFSHTVTKLNVFSRQRYESRWLVKYFPFFVLKNRFGKCIFCNFETGFAYQIIVKPLKKSKNLQCLKRASMKGDNCCFVLSWKDVISLSFLSLLHESAIHIYRKIFAIKNNQVLERKTEILHSLNYVGRHFKYFFQIFLLKQWWIAA